MDIQGGKKSNLDEFVLLSEDFTFQCRSDSCNPARALCWNRGSSGAELCVACPGSDGSLVKQAASCGTTLSETLDGPSLNASPAGHRALTQAHGRNSRRREEQKEELNEAIKKQKYMEEKV